MLHRSVDRVMGRAAILVIFRTHSDLQTAVSLLMTCGHPHHFAVVQDNFLGLACSPAAASELKSALSVHISLQGGDRE